MRQVGRFMAVAFAISLGASEAVADIPDELYQALGLERSASPKQLYEALVSRYHDPQWIGRGTYAQFWEPIPISQYLNPFLFYQPTDVDIEATRAECVECHTTVTPGWVQGWQKSVHANLDQIRALPDDDPRAYKKAILAEVEENLRSLGKLGPNEPLAEVSCIDCHIDVGAERGHHRADLRLPDAAVCGQCHLQQFAERESERDTLTWPQDQWPRGRPSHALDWKANVETAIWAAMEQREVAEGCTFCHNNQTKCDTCHTRHEFSTVEARKPDACATCHNGVDHNEFENYLLSKHGTIYKTRGDTWNWHARLADARTLGNLHAPTCQLCHMEYQGQFSHNLVRKVRWAFNPTPAIADNLHHPWFEERKEAWVQTCSMCHSPRFARIYLDYMDNAIKSGLEVEQAAKKVVEKLYEDGLLVGQKDNRPAPPAPDTDAPGGFFQLFWAKDNNPSAVEYIYAEMWEHDLIKHYKGVAHVNPGGYTYSEGWSKLIGAYAKIQDENTRLRQMAALEARLAALEQKQQGNLFTPDLQRAAVGVSGASLCVVGLALLFWGLGQRRRSP